MQHIATATESVLFQVARGEDWEQATAYENWLRELARANFSDHMLEEKLDAAKGEAPEPELVSRHTQAGIGLLTGVVTYGAAFGGLFALTFASAYGRVGRLSA